MKLLTKEIEARFKAIGSQQEVEDPIIVCKFFNPTGAGRWYCAELLNEEKDAPAMFFCYVTGLACDEWGYTSLKEMQDFKGRFGLGIERDLHFSEMKFSEIPENRNEANTNSN